MLVIAVAEYEYTMVLHVYASFVTNYLSVMQWSFRRAGAMGTLRGTLHARHCMHGNETPDLMFTLADKSRRHFVALPAQKSRRHFTE